jgi:Glycosyltransferase family 87
MNQLDSERARKFAWLAIAIYLVGLGIAAGLRTQADFNTYYRAGGRVLAASAIYPPTDSERFLYAPIFAIGFAPLAALPLKAAQLVFYLFNAFAFVELIIGAGVLLFGRERQLSAPLIVIPVLLCFRFIGNNIEHGQINLLTLPLLVWAIIKAEESRPWRAGLMLAAAILIKPFGLLVAAYMLVRGRFSTLACTAVWGIVLLLLPIFIFGFHGWSEQTTAYVQAVSSMTTRYRTMLTNQSAVSAVARLFEPVSSADANSTMPVALGMGFEFALTLTALGWVWRSGNRDRIALAALFCVIPGFAPISWKSYFAALIVPYMLMTSIVVAPRDESGEPPPRAMLTLFAISVLLNLAPGNRLNHLALFYSAHLVSALVAMAALFVLWRYDRKTSELQA